MTDMYKMKHDVYSTADIVVNTTYLTKGKPAENQTYCMIFANTGANRLKS